MTDIKKKMAKKSNKPVRRKTAARQNKVDGSISNLFKQYEWALIKEFSLEKCRPLHPQYL